MPINSEGMNDDFVKYFSLEEYIDKIRLLPNLLIHLEETNREFDNYIKKLKQYDREYIVNYWIYLLYEELTSTKEIEHTTFDESILARKDVYFDKLAISHKRIHELHNFITDGEMEPTFEYRKTPVNVSKIVGGREEIFWRGANPEDVIRFMNDFLNVYKQHKTSLVYSNPFLVSSLMHLLFLRIHPYTDGNGRTSRLIHNLKFTDSINKLYGTNLKLSPLNLSKSILVNKLTYVNRIDHIYFDLEHDNNEAINRWFEFILNMVDEQLYYSSNILENIPDNHIKNTEEKTISKMKIHKLR